MPDDLPDLGLLRLLSGREPVVVRTPDTPPLADEPLDAAGTPLLVWHSRRSWARRGGPGAEVDLVRTELTSLGLTTVDPTYAVATFGRELRAVWPLEAAGFSRWQVRTGVVAHGRLAWLKRLVLIAGGDRLSRRLRSGTLLTLRSR